jgi:chromosome segregation ATPase
VTIFRDFLSLSGDILREEAISQEYSRMSTAAVQDPEFSLAADDFSALEQRVLRTVELLKTERTARAAAEKRIEALELKVHQLTEQNENSVSQIDALEKDREAIRTRVERLLKQLDDIAG